MAPRVRNAEFPADNALHFTLMPKQKPRKVPSKTSKAKTGKKGKGKERTRLSLAKYAQYEKNWKHICNDPEVKELGLTKEKISQHIRYLKRRNTTPITR